MLRGGVCVVEIWTHLDLDEITFDVSFRLSTHCMRWRCDAACCDCRLTIILMVQAVNYVILIWIILVLQLCPCAEPESVSLLVGHARACSAVRGLVSLLEGHARACSRNRTGLLVDGCFSWKPETRDS